MADKYSALLQEIISNLEANKPRKQIMTVEELARYLGFSKSYVYKLSSQKIIPHYKPLGKSIFFKKTEIDTWILSHPVPPIDTLLSRAFPQITKTKNGNQNINHR